MDSLISPITSPNLNISGMDKVVNGEISGFPLNLSEIKVGNSILLDVLINTESHTTSSFSSNILTVSLSSPIEQQQSFKLKIDTPLQLPIDKNNQVTIKINAISPEKVAVKLISINNENPAKFITIPSLSSESSIQVPASNLSQTVLKPTEISYSTVTENPIIVDTTKSNSTISFHSLDLPKIIENISRQINLPETVISQITDGIKGAKIEVAFNTFVSKNITIDATDKPNPVYQTLSQLDIPVQNTIERLHVILNNFVEQLHDVTKPKPHLANVIEQIKNEIIPLKNFPIQGEAITKSDNSLVALKTVLGNILPDTLIKSENGTKAIIEIKNIFFPENKTNFSFNNLVSSAELVDNIPTIHQLINSNIQPQRNNHQPLREIINLLDNIQKNRNLDLSNKIIDKFPTFNDKMLPNMVNFIKGSITHSLETWIGKDTIRELSNLGDEGQEVISRLQGVLTTSHREGISWRIVEIPFYSGEYVNKIRVAVKNFTDDEDSKEPFSKRKNTTRFVVDTSFSKLGKFQFDGFSFRNERRFDLIIRTSQEISDDLYTNIFRLFKTTLSNLEYYGNIRVNVKENFIKVCEDDIHGETLKHGIYI